MKNNNENKESVKIKNVFLIIFVLISICLCATLIFSFKINSRYTQELSYQRDVFRLRAEIHPFGKSSKSLKGSLEIKEVMDGINLSGRIGGLEAGSSHGVHILEYADLRELESSKISDNDLLKHFNPTRLPHGCPSVNTDDSTYHQGDFGNIIADNQGIADFSLIKKIQLRALNGRLVVISKNKDNCDPNQTHDNQDDILAYGTLAVFKPLLQGFYSSYDKKDFNTRQLNSVEKEPVIAKDNKDSKDNIKPAIKKETKTIPIVPRFKAIPVVETHRNIVTHKKVLSPAQKEKIRRDFFKKFFLNHFKKPQHTVTAKPQIQTRTPIRRVPMKRQLTRPTYTRRYQPLRRKLYHYSPVYSPKAKTNKFNSDSYLKQQERRRAFLAKLFSHRNAPVQKKPVVSHIASPPPKKALIEEESKKSNDNWVLSDEDKSPIVGKDDENGTIFFQKEGPSGLNPNSFPILTQLTSNVSKSAIDLLSKNNLSMSNSENQAPIMDAIRINPSMNQQASLLNKNNLNGNQFSLIDPNVKFDDNLMIDQLKDQKKVLNSFSGSKQENNNLYISNIDNKLSKAEHKNKSKATASTSIANALNSNSSFPDLNQLKNFKDLKDFKNLKSSNI